MNIKETAQQLNKILDPDGTYSYLVERSTDKDIDFNILEIFGKLLEKSPKTGRRAAIEAQKARKRDAEG